MDSVARFIRQQPTKTFLKGEILIYQGQEPEALFSIRSGFVKIHDIAADGNEQLIWLAKKNDLLPIEWLFGVRTTTQFFYTAHSDVKVYTFDKSEFLDFAKRDPLKLIALIKSITAKYYYLLHQVNATQKPKARDKLLHALRFIAARFCEDKSRLKEVSVPLTHQDLANLVGVSRETASLELKKLKDEGVIDYDKTSFFIHTDRLSQLLV